MQKANKSLEQLKLFLQKCLQQNDDYWGSILQSDIRNIIPKYQVCKIQLIKNNLNKMHLIMQNLPLFISLQQQKSTLTHEINQLSQLNTQQLSQLKTKQIQKLSSIHYDVELHNKRRDIQIFCKELGKGKLNQWVRGFQGNNKWNQYVNRFFGQQNHLTYAEIHQNIVNLIQTLGSAGLHAYNNNSIIQKHPYVRLNTKALQSLIIQNGNVVKRYQNKLTQKILINKLVDNIFTHNLSNESKQINSNNQQIMNDEDQYWNKQVDIILTQSGLI